MSAAMDAIRTAVAMTVDRTTCVVRLSGPDARAAALWLLPSRLYLRDAQARQSLLLDQDGRPIADVVVCADDEDYLLLVEGLGRDALLAHLRANTVGRDVRIDDLGEELAVISVMGPWAWELLAEVLGPDLVALPYLNLFRIDEGYCVRAGKTGEYGYELLVRHGEAPGVLARLRERGAELDLVEVDPADVALARFEAWFFDPAHVPAGVTPIELQLQWRLAPDRDHLGRAAIERRRAEGIARLQTCMIAEGEVVAGDRVLLGDRTVGEVTRAARSDAAGGSLVAALVDRALAHGGITTLAIAHGGRAVPARTSAPPLVDNRSLYVDPRRHAYRARDEVKVGPLVRAPRAQLAAGPRR